MPLRVLTRVWVAPRDLRTRPDRPRRGGSHTRSLHTDTLPFPSAPWTLRSPSSLRSSPHARCTFSPPSPLLFLALSVLSGPPPPPPLRPLSPLPPFSPSSFLSLGTPCTSRCPEPTTSSGPRRSGPGGLRTVQGRLGVVVGSRTSLLSGFRDRPAGSDRRGCRSPLISPGDTHKERGGRFPQRHRPCG